jgi:RHS repeat-associated protein
MRRAALALLVTFGLDSAAIAQIRTAPAPVAVAALIAAAVEPLPDPAPQPSRPEPEAPETAAIEVTADPTATVEHTYGAGWNLVSVPLAPSNSAPAAVFDEVPAPLRVYDYVDGQVLAHGEAGFRNVAPGRAFWMLLAAPVAVRATGEPVATDAEYRIALKPGWNAIATPWLASVTWSDGQVWVRNGTSTLALGAAVDQGWIEGTIDDPDPAGVYGAVVVNSSPAGRLRPWRGYLLYSQITGDLIFGPPPPDTTPPTVAFTTPNEGDEIATLADIEGSADDDNLVTWTLESSLDGSAFSTLATGGGAVSGPLARVDPTLFENGLLSLRLTATDASGNSASTTRTVVIAGRNKLGAFRITFKDLEVPVAGMPIVVNRTYDSRTRAQSRDFGFGWSVEIEGRGRYTNNRRPGEGWRIEPSGGFLSLPCRNVNETKGHLTEIRFSDREVYRFRLRLSSPAPVLGGCFATAGFQQVGGIRGATLTILGDNEVFYQNDSDSVVNTSTFEVFEPQDVRLTTRSGRVLELNLRDGLRRVTDPSGNALAITPSEVQHSSGKSVGFVRDAGGRITAITDPSGQVISYAYDAAGNLQSVTDREGATVSYEYLAGHFLGSIVDPLGKTPSRNEYDADGRLTAVVDGQGHRTEVTSDPEANVSTSTDRLGGVTQGTYDERGNLTEVSLPGGLTTRATYDERGNTLTETNPLGQTTSYTYDDNDNVLSQTDAAGNTTRYTYDDHNRVLTETDPRGKVTTKAYDAAGKLLSVKEASGSETTYTYDARGNMLSQRDALGCEVRKEYDASGNLVLETDALGHSTAHTYDANGRRLTQTRTRTKAGVTETLVTHYSYDAEGRLLETTDPEGSVSRSIYDAAGRRTATVDKLGRRTEYKYDDLGRLIRTTHPDSTTDEVNYDAEGRKESIKDRAGRTTTFDYDAVDRLIGTLYADGTTVSTTYDAAGRAVATTDERGKITRFEYDAAGRRTKVKDPEGNESTFTFDGNANELSFRDARSQMTLYEYDDANRRVRTVYPDGTDETDSYDAVGRRIAHTDQAGRITRFEYDCAGRLTSVTDALGQVTRYGYDELGDLVSQTDANGRTTTFEYDAIGRRTRRSLPSGEFEAFAYDAAGNLVGRTDFSGATVQLAYDDSDRVLSRSYPDGSSVTFTYAANGKRGTAVDSRGTTSYAYDERDRLVSLTYPDGRKLVYEYDEKGNRTSLKAVLGSNTPTTAYAYDAASRLSRVTDPQNRTYSFSYDPNGNRASMSYPNGAVTSYTYSPLNRLTVLATQAGARLIQSYTFTLGPTGTRNRIDEPDGTSRSYTYDELYRLKRESVAGGAASYDERFTYDAVGNRLTRTKDTDQGTSTSLYTYDSRDRLLTENGAGYGWDANGDLVTKPGPDGATYVWDLDGRLRRVAKNDGTLVEHAYDADGNRVQTRVTPANGPPVVTNYLVDTAGTLSQVVAETDGSGALSSYYVRGDDLLSVIRGTGSTRFYHADGLGSIRRLTDEAGAITDEYTFSAFGELIAHAGPDPNAYLFAGEPLDPNSGFYYNRARWMDPRAGRFTSMDPVAGSPFDPPSLHAYLYAAADPVDKIDPSGQFFVSMMLGGVVSIMNRIQGMAVAVGGFLTINARLIAAQFAILQNAIRIASISGYARYQQLYAEAQALYPRIQNVTQMHHVVPQYIVRQLQAAGVNVPTYISEWVVPLNARYHQLITNAIRAEYSFGASRVFSRHPATLNELIRVLQEIYSRYPIDVL